MSLQRPSVPGSEPGSTPMPSSSSSHPSLACVSSTSLSGEEATAGSPPRLGSTCGRCGVMALQGCSPPSWWSRCSHCVGILLMKHFFNEASGIIRPDCSLAEPFLLVFSRAAALRIVYAAGCCVCVCRQPSSLRNGRADLLQAR